MRMRMMSVGEAEKIARELTDDENNAELFELANKLLSQEKVYGSEIDFHNFSLNFSKKSAYELACDILDKGLEQFPRSVDLLADYLQTGINCNRAARCDECYRTLQQIPKIRWTWRGFSFSIDYLLHLSSMLNEEELNNMKENMLMLADEYQVLFPAEEDPYICKAEIYDFFNDRSATKSLLQQATTNIVVCPKCSLRLSDMLFEEGAYKDALDVIEKCLYKSIQTQDSVNHGYLYYLSGLCRTVLLLKDGAFQDTKKVQEVYHDFAIAQRSGLQHGAYLRVMRRQIDILEIRSGVEYTD